MSTNSQNRKGTGETIAQALYPTVGRQPDGKKIEPATVAIPARLVSAIGKGAYSPYDKPPPELDNVYWNEPPASSVTDYAYATSIHGYHFERPGEFEQAKKAMLALEFGTTAARAAMAFVKRTAKHGRPPFTSDDARKAMEEQWGDKTEERLADVKALVDAAKKQYPNIGKWLSEESGLGNDPQFIAFLYRAAQRRKERGLG